MKLDSYGAIISGGDGGDSCQRQHTFMIRVRIYDLLRLYRPVWVFTVPSLQWAKYTFSPKPGIYRRHPDPDFWGSDPRNLSRDQLTPVICWNTLMAYTLVGPHESNHYAREQALILRESLKRGMFAQNIYPNWVDPRKTKVSKKMPDFLTPDLWGMFARTWIRSIWLPIALPFVIFGDLFLLLSVAFTLWAPKTVDGTLKLSFRNMDDVDDDNINTCIMTAQYTIDTPISWLARKMYKRFRAKNYGNEAFGEESAIMGALKWYHRAPAGNPELAELARPMVERY